jgi:hypothetical protein
MKPFPSFNNDVTIFHSLPKNTRTWRTNWIVNSYFCSYKNDSHPPFTCNVAQMYSFNWAFTCWKENIAFDSLLRNHPPWISASSALADGFAQSQIIKCRCTPKLVLILVLCGLLLSFKECVFSERLSRVLKNDSMRSLFSMIESFQSDILFFFVGF